MSSCNNSLVTKKVHGCAFRKSLVIGQYILHLVGGFVDFVMRYCIFCNFESFGTHAKYPVRVKIQLIFVVLVLFYFILID